MNTRTAQGSPGNACPTNALALRRWRHGLTRQPRKQQLDTVLTTLDALAEAELSPRRRLALTSLIHATAAPLLDELRERLRALSLPLPRQTRVTLEHYLAGLERLARVYLRIADAEAAQPRPSRARLGCAALTGLELHAAFLLTCARVYTTPPAAFWQDVHRLYRLVEDARLAERALRAAPDGRNAPKRSAGAVYRQILAFAVAQSESLQRNQIEPAFRALARPAEAEAVGRDLPSSEPDRPLIWIDTDAPRPPALHTVRRHCLRMDQLAAGERFMGTEHIVAGLEAMAAALGEEERVVDRPDSLRAGTVEHLLRRFRTRPVRAAERTPTTAGVDLKLGLDDIHATLSYVVTEDRDGRAQLLGAHERAANARLTLQTLTPEAATSAEPLPGPISFRGTGSPLPLSASRGRKSANDEATAWTVVDESADGLRLRRQGEQPSRASVGQLIAYRMSADGGANGDWCLATVRWLRLCDWDAFEIGVRKIPGSALPGLAERPSRQRKRAGSTRDPALVLAAAGDGETRVILPPFLYSRGQTVDIDVGDRTMRVELSEVSEGGGSFACFRAHAVEPRASAQATAPRWRSSLF